MDINHINHSKYCVWIGPEGTALRAIHVPQRGMMTEPAPGIPVMIVAFDVNGRFEQADLYAHGKGMVVSVGSDGMAIYRDEELRLLREIEFMDPRPFDDDEGTG